MYIEACVGVFSFLLESDGWMQEGAEGKHVQ